MKAFAAALMLATAALATQDGGPSVPPSAGSDGGAADAGSAEPDQEVIDHLDALERMELLENLELFDPGG